MSPHRCRGPRLRPLIPFVNHEAGSALSEHVLNLGLENKLDPFIPRLPTSRSEDKSSLSVIPVLLTVAPGARFTTLIIILTKLLFCNVYKHVPLD